MPKGIGNNLCTSRPTTYYIYIYIQELMHNLIWWGVLKFVWYLIEKKTNKNTALALKPCYCLNHRSY